MKHLKNTEGKYISGESYKKKILADNIPKKIDIIEEALVESNGEVPVHAHDFTDEIFYIVSGKASMTVNDKEFEVNPGDLIIVDKKEMHGFRNNSDKEFKLIVFKIGFRKGDSYLK